MLKRLLLSIGLLVATLVLLPALALGAAPPQRIVAVGDLHGDFDAWRQVALNARLIDPRNHWAGGSSILVQLGDILLQRPLRTPAPAADYRDAWRLRWKEEGGRKKEEGKKGYGLWLVCWC